MVRKGGCVKIFNRIPLNFYPSFIGFSYLIVCVFCVLHIVYVNVSLSYIQSILKKILPSLVHLRVGNKICEKRISSLSVLFGMSIVR